MSQPFRYMVIATLNTRSDREHYLHWLCNGHIQAVLQWAIDGEVIILDDQADGRYRVLSSYLFKDRTAYDRYVVEGAPALRAEGIALANSLGGIQFERSMGEQGWGSQSGQNQESMSQDRMSADQKI